ncbi:branched-chain amino acid ABC transporter permease [Tardiphaga sp. 20_F10_N6_6]|jgi:branched-chain amino acid transport system permease protein|uniref:Branched-chain amino acid ABC transporter permease n=1 Tax=Tardiphaga robiniae TaxID=943830 RepID=A0A7G6TTK4_9BRAD|nr:MULTISPECIES: branched-chain amino acid ABC transporter permease [Tardiphaga]QND70086.1 branched-chain amino acid ABC transporter permease [Tardiphaga robiniae]UFS73651.1 branched-chain amino acid ABC transporter permease [Tardiphaga sp. 37S4]
MNNLVDLDTPASPALATPLRTSRAYVLPLIVFAIFALVPLSVLWGSQSFILALVTRIMILALAAMSLDLLIGYGAMISFGHAAYVGLGAYSVAILSSHGITDGFIQLAVALGVSLIFALFTGAISLRTKGVYFIMITLAFGQMLFFLGTSLAAYGGDDGLTLASRSMFFGSKFLKNDVAMYYVAFGVLLGAYLLLRAIVASRFGRVLRGIRENPVRMEAIGFAPYRYQLTAYVIAGMIAGVSGFLLANQTEFVSPAYTAWQRSGDLIFVLVLGGLGSLHGAIIGAAVFSLLADILSHYTENWALIFGPILILVVLYARGGITGLFGSKS